MDDDRQRALRKKRKKKLLIFFFLAFILLAIFVLSQFMTAEELVNKIGLRNGYIVAFVASFFGGFSSITSFSFYGILIAFISGGLNPILLSLLAGTSLALGDMFLFYFGKKGRDLISGKLDKRIDAIAAFFTEKKREKYIPLISYLYISFIPLPNDWILLFLASIKYPQKQMNLIIILGDYTFVFLLTVLTIKGIVFFA